MCLLRLTYHNSPNAADMTTKRFTQLTQPQRRNFTNKLHEQSRSRACQQCIVIVTAQSVSRRAKVTRWRPAGDLLETPARHAIVRTGAPPNAVRLYDMTIKLNLDTRFARRRATNRKLSSWLLDARLSHAKMQIYVCVRACVLRTMGA